MAIHSLSYSNSYLVLQLSSRQLQEGNSNNRSF